MNVEFISLIILKLLVVLLSFGSYNFILYMMKWKIKFLLVLKYMLMLKFNYDILGLVGFEVVYMFNIIYNKFVLV